ncbi:MAG: histidinol-phosphatase [Chloroherpetonaceae bacterium]|nr:histidinol-phosphatase [Chloroherpetonaceae bacterium]
MFSEELELALDASREAGKIAMSFYRNRYLEVMTKRDASPVTKADQESEKKITSLIKKKFPNDEILGEEFGSSKSKKSKTSQKRKWIIDPIDGTKSFIHGVPLFGMMIGFEIDDTPTVGVVHFPALGETYYAEKGQGAFRNLQRLSVSKISTFSEATLLLTSPEYLTEEAKTHPFYALRDEAKLVRMWGDCYGHCLVAAGEADLMIDPKMNPWDCAALLPILTEAGGKIFDFKGKYHSYGGSLVSANAALGKVMLSMISKH